MLSPDLDSFIRDFIRSVWDLELLLLLRRTASRGWEPDELVRELRSSPLLVAEALLVLGRAGLVIQEKPGSHRYQAASPALDEMVQQLEIAYARTPAAVTRAIWAAPNTKIQTFADAFRLKKD